MAAQRKPAATAPTAEQCRAADPASSVWVTASAGTGKTRVLADRVLRLLLAGSEPQQILCLTFTKAAAAEMVARVQADLGRFATLPDAALADDLRQLLGRAGDGRRARQRAQPAGARARPAVRPADHDDPRLLPVAAAALSARGGRAAAFRRDRAAHRGRPDARGAGGGAGEPGGRRSRRTSRRSPCCWARARWPRGSRSCASSACAPAPTSAMRRPSVAALYRALDLPAGATPETVRAAACADPAIDRSALARRLSRAGVRQRPGWRALRPDHGLADGRPERSHRGLWRLRDRVPARRRPGTEGAGQRHHQAGGDARGGRRADGRAGAPRGVGGEGQGGARRRAHGSAAAGRRRRCSSAMRSARRGLPRSTTTI